MAAGLVEHSGALRPRWQNRRAVPRGWAGGWCRTDSQEPSMLVCPVLAPGVSGWPLWWP